MNKIQQFILSFLITNKTQTTSEGDAELFRTVTRFTLFGKRGRVVQIHTDGADAIILAREFYREVWRLLTA